MTTRAPVIIVNDGATKWMADATELLAYIDRHGLDTGRAHHSGGTEISEELDYDHMCQDIAEGIAPLAGEGSDTDIEDYPTDGVAVGMLTHCCGLMTLERP